MGGLQRLATTPATDLSVCTQPRTTLAVWKAVCTQPRPICEVASRRFEVCSGGGQRTGIAQFECFAFCPGAENQSGRLVFQKLREKIAPAASAMDL